MDKIKSLIICFLLEKETDVHRTISQTDLILDKLRNLSTGKQSWSKTVATNKKKNQIRSCKPK